MTTRSFLKRLHALVRYRQALKHMDQYPDATAEELSRDHTCIICREEMRPWDPADATQVERSRAKKLPCGHILHSGCLKSWLERQQVCPTCRRPVARDGQQPAPNGGAVVFRLGLNFPAAQNQQPQPPANGQAPGGQPAQARPAAEQGNDQNRAVRMFNLGPLRLGFAQGGVDEIREMAQRLQVPAGAANQPAHTPAATPQETHNPSLDQVRTQLMTLGQQVRQDMANAHNAAQELQLLTLLMNELVRLRQLQQQPLGQQQSAQPAAPVAVQVPLPYQQQVLLYPGMHPPPQGQPPLPASMHPFGPRPQPPITRHVGAGGAAIPAGSPDLPEGMVIPPGWTLLPLQRLEGVVPPPDPGLHSAQAPAMGTHDTLQSLFPPAPNHPRSRGASPAPGTGASGQTETTSATSNNHDLSGALGAHGATNPDTAGRRQQEAPPPVTAPIPRAPNWGGPAQLFGNRGTSAIFGDQREPTPAPPYEPGETSNGPAAATAVNGVAAERNSDPRAEARPSGSSSSARGGPRAATVEEADDDDDDER
ncbi:hypothetical protein VTK56DRAFT_156 [Thermocarpiscus australiensis]